MAGEGDTDDGKANFTDIYTQRDPRAYFQNLGELDYRIPAYGVAIFEALLAARRELVGGSSRRPARVLDLCCSYGVNAALLQCDLTLDDLYAHYRSDELAGVTPRQTVEIDRDFYARHRRVTTRPPPPVVVGVDVAENAIAYATEAGLLAEGWTLDLERDAPPAALEESIAATDLVTVTGGIGYITARTFRRVLACTSPQRPPWVASLVLRMFDYSEFVDALSEAGLVTEELDGVTFPQRRFASEEEREFALARLAELGVDPTGKEAEGEYHTTLFVSRPREHAAAFPLNKLFAGVQLG